MWWDRIILGIYGTALLFLGATVSVAGTADTISGATKKPQVVLPKDGPTWTVIGEVWGIRNFVVRYHGRLYRGGKIESEKALDFLKHRGITTVFSVTPDETERKLLKDAGIELIELPFEKTGVPREVFDRFIAEAKKRPGPLYVHCLGGKQRGGILSAAYRIAIDGFTLEQALAEFLALGGDEKVDAGLIASLREYLRSSGRINSPRTP